MYTLALIEYTHAQKLSLTTEVLDSRRRQHRLTEERTAR